MKFERDRQELANAEKLFDMSITMYPEMQQMEKEIKGLEMIFSIYVKQKVRNVSVQYDIFSCISFDGYFLY